MSSEPIRVLHMIGSLNIGGSQSMILNLYKNIDRSKIQFDFIIDHADGIFYKETIEKMGGKVYVLPNFTGYNFFKVKKAWKLFFKNHREYKILHTHVRSYASIFIPIAKKNNLTVIAHSHSTSNGKGIVAIFKKILQYPIKKEANYLFACSLKSGEWLFGKKATLNNNFYVIKNAIDVKKYAFNLETRREVRNELDLKDEVVFIHVGRFHESKNHIFLLEVFSEIIKIRKNSKLLLVGDGELRDLIINKIEELNLVNKVIVLGNRSDVQRLFQCADAFVFPSKWEGLPVSVVEAQASGIPCYISDNITSEVDLTSLVKKISLESSPKVWAEEIMKSPLVRLDVSDAIIENGFDINETSKKLSLFYEEIYNEKIYNKTR